MGERVRERWIEAGVPADVVNDAIAYVQTTGGVLSEAELHPGVLRLLRDLHDGTWFQLDGGYLIETNLGSRQGCKFGAIIFNLMYCRALDDLRCALRNEGLLFVFEYYPDAAPYLVLRNMCVARLVGSSATLCRVTNMSDLWSMVLVVWNVSYKRALLLQTECISRLPRNSRVPSTSIAKRKRNSSPLWCCLSSCMVVKLGQSRPCLKERGWKLSK